MVGSIAAGRLAALVEDFDRHPAYAGLADRLRLLIGDARVDSDLRLPSERDLSAALGVSRTTVTRAYASLVETGYAVARQGSGTYTRVPGGRLRARDRTLMPRSGDEVADLSCAAPAAPPALAATYAEAMQDLPIYLGGHGYFPTGLPALQEAVAETYVDRGLPTEPEQILVVPGALSAVTIVAQALVRPRGRVLVESPGYPNAHAALRRAGARHATVPMDVGGWDLDAIGRVVRQARPALAYVIPDFQNPTGNLMSNAQREQYAALLRRAGTVAVVDESHAALRLDGRPMPRPFATYAPETTITLGSASKSLWGGLRVGWIRCPQGMVERLVGTRVAVDLGSPVLEQLVTARLLRQRDDVWQVHRARLRAQRDALASALADRLPDWRFRLPRGGLSLWCELPAADRGQGAVAVATEAERRGVVVSPGPVFGVEGGFDSFVRIPYTRPEAELRDAVDRLAAAWEAVRSGAATRGRAERRVMVA